MNNQFPRDSWDDYVRRLESATPALAAIAVTDYYAIDGYKKVCEYKAAGRLPNVQLIFPNIELRVSPPTTKHKGVNFHLLIDPTDPKHETRIRAALAQLCFEYHGIKYHCTRDELRDYGRALDPKQQDDHAAYCHGVEHFKTDFSQFRALFETDPWLVRNCLVAVSNSNKDGVFGLPQDHGYGPEIEEMCRFSQLIFSPSPNDRKYWLGKRTDSLETLTQRFGGAKPCIHGSDAHRLEDVARPAQNRFCWVKADVTFEGLRQVVLEPEERVLVDTEPPRRARSNWIRTIRTANAPWLANSEVPMNPGLVAIIGPRGSGKTALADLIALGADAFDVGPASFLAKASPHANGAKIELDWADDREKTPHRIGDEPSGSPTLRYLSQHFVEQLCSSADGGARLVEEIEQVIFDRLDEDETDGAFSFAELRRDRTEASDVRIRSARALILDASSAVAKEVAEQDSLPKRREVLSKLDVELKAIRTEIGRVTVTGKADKLKLLEAVEGARKVCELKLAELRAAARGVAGVKRQITDREAAHRFEFEQLCHELKRFGILEKDLPSFRLRYTGDPIQILDQRERDLLKEIDLLSNGRTPPLASDPPSHTALRSQHEALQKEIGLDAAKERRFLELQKQLRQKETEREKLVLEIAAIEGSADRIKEHQRRRTELYTGIFDELALQKEMLETLYRPLVQQLAVAPGEQKKLSFAVKQHVDIESWAAAGEALLDLRKRSAFQERGSLAEVARELLADPWANGDKEAIALGHAELRRRLGAPVPLVPTASRKAFAEWLYSTDHIRLRYSIRYEDTDIGQLSPGTRGVVLLLLYLALDEGDDRPLIVDQPEENLDPKSVYEVLARYFREARHRRQIIVVTHNPNLVVTTDADQVIVAHSERVPGRALPQIAYRAGALENPEVRDAVCEILEGGEAAFLLRERRYGLRRRYGAAAPGHKA